MTHQEIIEKIKQKAEEEKMTHYRIGKIIGSDPSIIKRWLDKEVIPSLSNTTKLAEAVGLEIYITEKK